MIIKIKKCSKCKNFKLLEDFYLKRNTADMKQSYCKKCSNEDGQVRIIGKRKIEQNKVKEHLLELLNHNSSQTPKEIDHSTSATKTIKLTKLVEELDNLFGCNKIT